MGDPIARLNAALEGRYQVERALGAGGMGEVYLARDDRLRRHVALKRVRAGAGPEHRARFLREARSAARLSHRSVVQIFDIIGAPDDEIIVMEYVDGTTLAELLKQGALDAREVVDVLLQVCDGVQAAHEAGLVHRDLKGENVLVTHDGDAKILDFGLAKLYEEPEGERALTRDDAPIGTFRAMSPEQCEGSAVDARSDLFSLGVLLYEALTGHSPFLGRTRVSTLTRVVTHDPPPPREVNGTIPEALSRLTMALLEKDRADRLESVAEVGLVLESVRDSDEIAHFIVPRLDYGATGLHTPSDAGSDALRQRRARDRARERHGSSTRTAHVQRSWARYAVPVFALVAAGLALVVWNGRAAATSSDRIMVFPLVAGTDVAASVGEDVATIVGHALDGAEPLTWVDGWSRLDATTRGDVRTLELERAMALARDAACAHFVTGRVVREEGGMRVLLDLWDVRSGDRVGGSEATTGSDDAWRAGLSAMSDLLPTLIPTAVPAFGADFTDAAPAAVALFLRGESAHRRARISESLELFRSAFAADSTFWVAGIRAAQAASWQHDQGAARDLLARALRGPLPPATASFARGVLAYVRYDAEEAARELRAALGADTTMTVAWAALGEVYRHRAPREPWTDGPSPFSRAFDQDSLAGYVLFHRLEELIRDGDLAKASRVRSRFRTQGPDPHLLHQIDVMYDCVSEGPASRDWTDNTREGSQNVAFAAAQLLAAGRRPECAEALYHAVLVADTAEDQAEGRYWSGLHGLTGSKLARGDPTSARRLIVAASEGFESFQSLIDRSVVSDRGVQLPADDAPWPARDVPLRSIHEGSLTRWSELAILVAAVHPELHDLGELGAADIRAIGAWSDIPYRTSIWMLGLWEARQGRFAEADQATARLREIAEGYDDEVLRAYTRRMADALEAHKMLAEGNEDGGYQRLRGLTANADEGTTFAELIGSFALERAVLAELEEGRGNYEQALALVRGFDAPSAVTNAIYLRLALQACDRLATALGRVAEATECRARLRELSGL